MFILRIESFEDSAVLSVLGLYKGWKMKSDAREDSAVCDLRQNQSCRASTLPEHIDVDSEETLYFVRPRLKVFSDWFLKILASSTLEAIFPAASLEYAPLVEEFWNSAGFQVTYKRISEFESPPAGVEGSVLDPSSEMYRFAVHAIYKSKTQPFLGIPTVYTFSHKSLVICKTWYSWCAANGVKFHSAKAWKVDHEEFESSITCDDGIARDELKLVYHGFVFDRG